MFLILGLLTFDIAAYHWFWPFSIESFTNLAILRRFVKHTLIWIKDAMNRHVTRHNYKQDDLSNLFSKTIIFLNNKWTISSTNLKKKYKLWQIILPCLPCWPFWSRDDDQRITLQRTKIYQMGLLNLFSCHHMTLFWLYKSISL